jgi:hypothetical protein
VDGDVSAQLAALGAEQRGLVAALQLLGTGEDALRAVIGAAGCGATLAALQGLPRDRRARIVAELLRQLAAPLPDALEDLDPSWVEAIVDMGDEPPELIRAALAPILPLRVAGEAALRQRGNEPGAPWSPDPIALGELQRMVLAPLIELTVQPAGPRGADLAARPTADLLDELAREGARTLGRSLAGAPLGLRAEAMARAGTPWSAAIASAAAAPLTEEERDQARAVVARAAAATGDTSAGRRLRAVGALTLAPVLAAEGPGSLARVAGRLPITLGRLLWPGPERPG